ncbi:hypothetical protein J5N97_025179 [Dioscorea zingiberensis]|uniref:YDG domain-containing protein n=1 Tax=Dioscorea zingiberensis TaxID=325984 RepID=A0A9D5C9B7_9LILI|nr:hypothetical protein J5N97_025179 [Dioscorea zingiberensis]
MRPMLNPELAGLLESGTQGSNATTTEDEMVMRRNPSHCRVSAVKNPTSIDNKKESLKKSNSKSQSKSCSSRKRNRSEESLNKSEEVAKTEEVDHSVVQQEVVARRTVGETLHMFQIIYRKLLQKEESPLKEPRHGLRVVLMAYRLFKEKNPGLDDRKYLGNVPGIQIGDEFHFRAECLLTGLHRQMSATIDFLRHDGMNVAVSIVVYGSYASFIKSLDNLVFPGTGGSSEDQKLMLGNLALKNSIDAKNPVRVIRGIKGTQPNGTAKSKFKKVVKYVYDGLYSVEKFTREKGKHGHYIFLFHLSRLPGQPELGMQRVKNMSVSSALSGQCVEDISYGEEKIAINGSKQINSTTTEDELVMRQYPSCCCVSAVKNPTSLHNKKEKLKKSSSKNQSKCCSSRKRKRSEESLNKGEEVSKTEEVDRGVVQQEVVARRTVRETLHMFQIIYRKLLQKEESRLKEPGHGMRVVLMAYRLFKEKNPGLDDKKYLGNVPGIQIGDEFHFRAECLLTGLHRQMPGTIDFMRHDGINVAVSIVAYGSYASFIKSLDNLVFPGAGLTSEDQKLMLGNLALKNSIDVKNPVRVIWGIKGSQPDATAKSKHKKVVNYVYDGLYSVEKFTREKGKHGHYIFLFHLSRLPGQPELGMRRVKNLSISSALSGQCIEDISHGKEKIPINVVNTIDDQLPPPLSTQPR